MKIEQISNHSYRVRKQYQGTQYTLYFDHKPSEREITLKLSDQLNESTLSVKKQGTVKAYMMDYISIKDNILSPSTIRSYRQLATMFPEWILSKNLFDLQQADIQRCVNDYALDHSPKSVKNFNGFIIAVLKMYRPNFRCNIALPKRPPTDIILPTKEQVIQIIEYFANTEYHIPIQLAVCGLRRSELTALTLSDLDGNTLTIDKGLVTDSDNNLVIKDMPKTLASMRQIYIPDALANEIREKGYIYKGYPNNIVRALHRAQDALNIPRFRLHDLRHFYVSYAHSLGMSDADIMKAGGWTTDEVMKRTYRHAMDSDNEQKRIADSILT